MLDFGHYKLVTFDCYGTLVDWETGILDAIRPVLERHSVVADDERILETYAEIEAKQEEGDYVRYEVLLRLLMAEMSLRLGFDASLQELDCVSKSIGDWKPFPDVVPGLKKLSTKYQLAVISNIDDKLFKKTATRLEVEFDWVITAQQAKAYKPSPRIFEQAISRFGIERDRILHVAQSVYHDIVPAKSLGLATVRVDRRVGKQGSGATPPAQGKADLEVPDLESLVRLAGLA